MKTVKVTMKKERHCKHSVVYHQSDTNLNAPFKSVYLTNPAYQQLGEPDNITVTASTITVGEEVNNE